MKKCKYCAEEIPDASLFCPFCGKSTSPDTQSQNQIGQTPIVEEKKRSGGSSAGWWVAITILVVIIVILLLSKSNFSSQSTQSPVINTPTKTVTRAPTSKPTIMYIGSPIPLPAISAGQSWRIQDFPNSKLLTTDYTNNTVDTNQWVEGIARNNAIPSPYYWSCYQLPDDTRFADIEAYFISVVKNMGYKLGRDEQGMTKIGGDTYLLSFIKGSGKM